jgi:hypothetical protein
MPIDIRRIIREELENALSVEEPDGLPRGDQYKDAVGIFLINEKGKLFVEFNGRIPAEKYFGKEVTPSEFDLSDNTKSTESMQISNNPAWRPSGGDVVKAAREERHRVWKKDRAARGIY